MTQQRSDRFIMNLFLYQKFNHSMNFIISSLLIFGMAQNAMHACTFAKEPVKAASTFEKSQNPTETMQAAPIYLALPFIEQVEGTLFKGKPPKGTPIVARIDRLQLYVFGEKQYENPSEALIKLGDAYPQFTNSLQPWRRQTQAVSHQTLHSSPNAGSVPALSANYQLNQQLHPAQSIGNNPAPQDSAPLNNLQPTSDNFKNNIPPDTRQPITATVNYSQIPSPAPPPSTSNNMPIARLTTVPNEAIPPAAASPAAVLEPEKTPNPLVSILKNPVIVQQVGQGLFNFAINAGTMILNYRLAARAAKATAGFYNSSMGMGMMGDYPGMGMGGLPPAMGTPAYQYNYSSSALNPMNPGIAPNAMNTFKP